ncbi:carbohydrate kinase family protein [Amycolatopsis rubida]|uniref:Carbohydrate kinase family protein n=1 Tax=Amycolatopsis rubida TaxID=112413 RepID=A0ABX0C7T4_9PSEU|nr:carbohydrate kinase family protein [Amycolatopsis sp. M39]MYW96085.1 hypothetical protein [Amycolatopsis rubida]NEC61076.1 carbohydrate kinase family protein [Amycolatopsis rubida]
MISAKQVDFKPPRSSNQSNCRSGAELVPVPTINAADPTGAGDSFMASILRDLWLSGPPTDLAGWAGITSRAVAAAAITCSSLGGAASMPTRKELDTAHATAR